MALFALVIFGIFAVKTAFYSVGPIIAGFSCNLTEKIAVFKENNYWIFQGFDCYFWNSATKEEGFLTHRPTINPT